MGQRIATTISPAGTRIGYAVTGSGPPLVYVSGWLGHLELSWALPAERAYYEALADGRTLIRYDKPGCGLSERTSPEAPRPGPYSIDQELDAPRAAFARYQRDAASAQTACAMLELAYRVDVRDILPQVSAPTLAVHRDRDRAAPIGQGRRLADGIPQARFEAIPGRSHLPYVGDAQPLTRAIRRFLGLPARHRGAAPTLTARQPEGAALVVEGAPT